MVNDLIAILDIGKTNAKLSLVVAETGETPWSVQTRCGVTQRKGIRALAIEDIERFFIDRLANAPGKEHIRAIVPVAHGAAAVLLSATGDVLASPDYEDSVFESVREAYRKLRDPFELTYSPFLPLGLNLGRQLYYLQQTDPEMLRSCAAILPYPQYWAWRLSGIMASELTSLGCHTDLWQPGGSGFSSLAKTQGWADLFPPLRRAGDLLGNISPTIARITGLDPMCGVACGIHDSNASYLCYRANRPEEEHFAVVSTGTWTVIMAHGTKLGQLRESRDMLANVDALGSPVPTARFMSGREYEQIAGDSDLGRQPTVESLSAVLEKRALALPSFAGTGGPFVGLRGKLINTEQLNEQERGALATVYCALQTDLLLDLLGAPSPVIIDGPLCDNPLFARLVARFRAEANGRSHAGTSVLVGDNRAGPAECSRLLLGYRPVWNLRSAIPLGLPDLAAYREHWRAEVTSRLASV